MAVNKKTLPEVMWFGTTDGEWPIQAFDAESLALAWVSEKREDQTGVYVVRKRRIWRATISDAVEYELFAPAPTLIIKAD